MQHTLPPSQKVSYPPPPCLELQKTIERKVVDVPSNPLVASHHTQSDDFVDLMTIIACVICLETLLYTPFLSPLLLFLVLVLIFILYLFPLSCSSVILHVFSLQKNVKNC